jgi:hypothetical protein
MLGRQCSRVRSALLPRLPHERLAARHLAVAFSTSKENAVSNSVGAMTCASTPSPLNGPIVLFQVA